MSLNFLSNDTSYNTLTVNKYFTALNANIIDAHVANLYTETFIASSATVDSVTANDITAENVVVNDTLSADTIEVDSAFAGFIGVDELEGGEGFFDLFGADLISCDFLVVNGVPSGQIIDDQSDYILQEEDEIYIGESTVVVVYTDDWNDVYLNTDDTSDGQLVTIIVTGPSGNGLYFNNTAYPYDYFDVDVGLAAQFIVYDGDFYPVWQYPDDW